MFNWTRQTIGWYAAAVAYTGFGRKLADIVTDYLPKNETVCDLGCGIGWLALELAARGYAVTAMDKSAGAIAWLRDERDRRGLSTLEALEQDWRSLEEEPLWDNIVMVSAGRSEDTEPFFRRLCRKRLIVADRVHLSSHVRADGGTSAQRRILPSAAGPMEALQTFSLEFGQPLTSLEDARAYISVFGGAAAMGETLSTLVETGDAAFPFYLPYRKDLELIVRPSLWLEGEHPMHTLLIGNSETNHGAFIDRLLAELKPCPRLYGYRSVKEAADETGNAPIYIYPASSQRRQTRDNLLGWCKDSRSMASPEAFERHACLIEDAQPDGLLVLDEIGPMESQMPRFSAAVLAALEGDTPILASVRDIDIPFLESVRSHPKARRFTLTRENAEALFPEVLAHLLAQLEGEPL